MCFGEGFSEWVFRRKSGKGPAQLILRSPSVTFCRSHKFVPSLFSVHDPPVMNLWSGEAGSEFQCNLRDCIPCSSRHQFFVYFLGLGPKLAQYDIQLQLTWLNLDWSFLKPTTYKPKRKSALIKLGKLIGSATIIDALSLNRPMGGMLLCGIVFSIF